MYYALRHIMSLFALHNFWEIIKKRSELPKLDVEQPSKSSSAPYELPQKHQFLGRSLYAAQSLNCSQPTLHQIFPKVANARQVSAPVIGNVTNTKKHAVKVPCQTPQASPSSIKLLDFHQYECRHINSEYSHGKNFS